MDIPNLITRISKLTLKEKKHIHRILIKNSVTYSKNLNGYFFNLGSADSNILELIKQCLELIEPNREFIKQLDVQREELRVKYTELIKERLLIRKFNNKNKYENMLTIKPYSNLSIQFDKKTIIKRQVKNENEDLEEIIKKYKKRNTNFSKNSLYYRILQKMKKKHTNKTKDEDDSQNTPFDNYDINGNEEIEEIEEIEEMEAVEDLEEEIYDETQEQIEEIEENNYIIEDDYDDNHSEKDDDIEEFDIREFQKQENEVEKEVQFENSELKEQILYYRKLLNEKLGFQFDENKYCRLVYQDYIPKK